MTTGETTELAQKSLSDLDSALWWVDSDMALYDPLSAETAEDDLSHVINAIVRNETEPFSDDDREERCKIAVKLALTYEAVSTLHCDSIEPNDVAIATDTLLEDILNNTNRPLSEEEKTTLLNWNVTRDVLDARRNELDSAVKAKIVPNFLRNLFRARSLSDPTTDKVFKALSAGKTKEDGCVLDCLEALSSILTDPVYTVSQDEDGVTNFKQIDLNGVDRTLIPETLHKVFGITDFGDHNPNLLVQDYLALKANQKLGGAATTLVLRSSTDWNGALMWASQMEYDESNMEALSRNGLVRFEVNSPRAIVKALFAARRLNGGPVSNLILHAHGRRDFIQLDHYSKANLTRGLLVKNKAFVKSLAERCLTPDATIHFVACNSGHKKGVAYTIWKITGLDVTGSRDKTNATYVQPANGPLQVTYHSKPVHYPAKPK